MQEVCYAREKTQKKTHTEKKSLYRKSKLELRQFEFFLKCHCHKMTQNSSTLEEYVLTFKDLDNLIFNWETDLPEFYRQFVLQTEELQSWMFQELALREKVCTIT